MGCIACDSLKSVSDEKVMNEMVVRTDGFKKLSVIVIAKNERGILLLVEYRWHGRRGDYAP